MANKALYRDYIVPDSIVNKLKKVLDSGYNGKNVQSIKKVVENPSTTYRQLANYISKWKNGKYGAGEDYEAMADLVQWSESELEGQANSNNKRKELSADIGMNNQFKKDHFKDKNNNPMSRSSQKPVEAATTVRDIFMGRNPDKTVTEELKKRFKELINR